MKQRAKKIALWSLGSLTALAIIGSFGSSSTQTNSSLETGRSSNSSQQSTDAQTKSIIETRTIQETEAIPYKSVEQNDSSLYQGSSSVAVKGQDGVKTVTYEVTYENGVETSRRQISEDITAQPIDQVTKIGTRLKSNSSSGSSCYGGYINSVGNCVQSPGSNPAGASARCVDGSYSYSQSRRGTCSHHGGVSQWL